MKMHMRNSEYKGRLVTGVTPIHFIHLDMSIVHLPSRQMYHHVITF
jgi:hypothetical protein